MRRRAFITLLGGAAAWPLAARGQQAAMPVVGYLNASSPGNNPTFLPAFLKGLGEAGYVEGKNVAIDYRWADDQYDRLPAMAADLVRQQVAVIAATGGPSAALAAKQATTTIPVVFTSGADPVAASLVASLGRPGGNVPGMSLFYAGLASKRLGLLRDLIPKPDVVGFLVNPKSIESESQLKDVLAAAHIIGQQLVVVNAANESEIDEAFATLVSRQARGLLRRLRRILFPPARSDNRAGGAACNSWGLLGPRLGRRRRPDELRNRYQRNVSPSRHLCRPNSQGGQASRPACGAANQIRAGHQPQDGEGTRPHGAADHADDGRRGDRMRRRTFITLLGGAAAWSLSARAQQPAMPVVGHLNPQSPDGQTGRLRGFRQGLKEAGYVEGENVAIEYGWAHGQFDRLPALAAELVRRQVSVIVATGGPASAMAAKAATTTIPIVFGVAEDPVKLGLVASLARPGGNLTGINFFTGELGAKQLGLLRELVPSAAQIAVLTNPANVQGAATAVAEVEAAARTMGLQIQVFNASTGREINTALAAVARERTDALFITGDPYFTIRRVQLANLAARYAIPASFVARDFPEAGGLMSYGTNISDGYRQIGIYAGRILKGTKPADLPIVQASKFELVINLATAMMFGLEVPPSLLARADEVMD